MKRLLAAARHPHDYGWGLRPWRLHSKALLVAGLAYIVMGLTYLTTAPEESRQSALSLAIRIMPLSAWGVVWIAVGSLAVVSSRWPPASETWGYQLLTMLSCWWALMYVGGVVLGVAALQSITGGVVWGLLAYLWYIVAQLRNPDDTAVVHVHPAPPREG